MIFGSPMGSPVGDKITKKGDKHGEQKTCVCVCMLEPGDKIYQNGSQNDPKTDSKLILKSMIFVIFLPILCLILFFGQADYFFSRRKRQQQQKKRKMKQGKTREDKARQAQGKTRQKEQKKTS